MKKSATVKPVHTKSASTYRFVDERPDLVFDKAGRVSIYAQALQSLLGMEGKTMEVDRTGARSGIAAQASKLGFKVLFAESDGKLYVKIIGKDSPEESVLEALRKENPQLPVTLQTMLAKRFKDTPGFNAQKVLQDMTQNSLIKLDSKVGSPTKWLFLCREAKP